MATLPDQIRKQTEAAADFYKQDPEGADKEADTNPTPVVEEEDVADETLDDGTTQAPADEQAGDTPTEEAEDENSETYAQRWRSLQGAYNATTRRERELGQRVQQMEELFASMPTQDAPVDDEAGKPPTYLSEVDVDEYGESIEVMRKVSREELGPVAQRLARIEDMLKQMETSVVPQVQDLAQNQKVSQEQRFWSDLGTAVPNWQEVNGEQGFQDWLMEVDPLTGLTRQTYLDDAQGSLDSNRVATFFRTWLESSGTVKNAHSTGSTQSSELEKQVAPGRSRGSGTPDAKPDETYTPADVAKFYDDVRSGKYKTREKERNQIERDIFAAQQENRIISA